MEFGITLSLILPHQGGGGCGFKCVGVGPVPFLAGFIRSVRVLANKMRDCRAPRKQSGSLAMTILLLSLRGVPPKAGRRSNLIVKLMR